VQSLGGRKAIKKVIFALILAIRGDYGGSRPKYELYNL